MTQSGSDFGVRERGDTWLVSLVAAFESVAERDIGTGACDPVGCEALRDGVVARLAQPADAYARRHGLGSFSAVFPLSPDAWTPDPVPHDERPAHSPAICSRRWLPCSSPRSLAS